jgi:hypothetical protein
MTVARRTWAIGLVVAITIAALAGPVEAVTRKTLHGGYFTTCRRVLALTHPATKPRTYTVTRFFHTDGGVLYMTSRRSTYRLHRSSPRTLWARGPSDKWIARFTFKITRWDSEDVATKYTGTTVYRRTFRGQHLVDYYKCVGTQN